MLCLAVIACSGASIFAGEGRAHLLAGPACAALLPRLYFVALEGGRTMFLCCGGWARFSGAPGQKQTMAKILEHKLKPRLPGWVVDDCRTNKMKISARMRATKKSGSLCTRRGFVSESFDKRTH